MNAKVSIKPLDIVIIVLAVAAIAIASISVYDKKNAAPEVVITGQGGEWIYPLKDERQLEIDGPIGVTTVAIHDGKVRIVDSPCPNKTCVAAGAISEPGQWVACLPNQVFVRVEGSSNDKQIDAGVY
jgi:hypothetical protein